MMGSGIPQEVTRSGHNLRGAWIPSTGSAEIILGDNAGVEKLSIKDSDLVEVAYIGSDGNLTIQGSANITIDDIIQGQLVVDSTRTDALVVRKDSSGGDVFVVDTTNSIVKMDADLQFIGGQAIYADANTNQLYLATGGQNIMGHNASISVGGSSGTVEGRLQVLGTSIDNSSFVMARWAANTASGIFGQAKSRNATIGSYTIVQDGDVLGRHVWSGDDGVNLNTIGAEIRATVNGTPLANRMPTDIEFYTALGGANDDIAMTMKLSKMGTLSNMGGRITGKTNVADAAYNPSVLTADRIVAFTSLTAARAVTISTEDRDSGSATNPRIITIKDESGNCSGGNTITISLETSGNIDGAATAILSTAYASVDIYLNGTNGFII